MTRTQAKKRLEEILDLIEELKSDCEEESSNIEPYENRYDLTEQQQERQDWLDELASELESAYDSLSYYND